MDRGAWQATALGVANSRTQLREHTHSESQVCPPGESSSGYEEGSETPGSSSPSHAFQKSEHALWPFCALASAPLKDKKAAAPDFPSHPL